MKHELCLVASTVLASIWGVDAGRSIKRTGPPAQPSCVDFTPYVYAGCFTDETSPRTLLYGSNLDFKAMTVERCVAFCKGNDYRYAGLEYYGECYCGATVSGAQVDESNCKLPCNGNKTESCGGNKIISIYQDPTFPEVDPKSISDYRPMGCYSEGPNGRALAWRGQLSQSTLTVESCLTTCKSGGYAFAGLEFGRECYCGLVLGNGTKILNNSQCNMPCTGNRQQSCGGRSTLNLYVADDLESTEPCESDVPQTSSLFRSIVQSSTTSSSPFPPSSGVSSNTFASSIPPTSASSSLPTSSATSTSNSLSPMSFVVTSSEVLSSSTIYSSTSTPTPTSSTSSSLSSEIGLSSTETFTSSFTTISLLSSKLRTLGSSTTSMTSHSVSAEASSSLSLNSVSIFSIMSSDVMDISTSFSATLTTSSLNSTSRTTILSSTISIDSPPSSEASSVLSSSTVSATPALASSLRSSITSTTTTSQTSLKTSSRVNTTSTPYLTSTSAKISSSSTSTTPTSKPICVSTVTTYPTPSCDYKVGAFCSSSIPQFNDAYSCLRSFTACILQLSSCYRVAGYPDSLECDGFDDYCSSLDDFCDRACPGPRCSLGGFKSSGYPSIKQQGTSGLSTITYACSSTFSISLIATPTSSFPSITPVPPVPTYPNICKQPNSPSNGYGSVTPVGKIPLPLLSCNNDRYDFNRGKPFKLYTSSDTSKCPSYQRSGDYGPTLACKDACDLQYQSCTGTYAESCKTYKNKAKRAVTDTYANAVIKCKSQRDDCYTINNGVNGANTCGSYESGTY